ncbi:hypothetical protein ACWEQG_16090 [Microbispora sp. NPDC004025]
METHHTRFVQAGLNTHTFPALTVPEEAPVMDRLVAEARREFPDWCFARRGDGWVARSSRVELSAATLAELRHNVQVVSRWRVWRSDVGRWWATRERPFGIAAEKAGAYRTVDADDLDELCRVIAEQESMADLAARS